VIARPFRRSRSNVADRDRRRTPSCRTSRLHRLIVLDHGRIVEQGEQRSHAELLAHGSHYAARWRRQSGGFLDAADMQAAE
jgi:hypothetical protein